MNAQWLRSLLSIYLSLTIPMLEYVYFLFSLVKRFPFLVTIADAIISVYFHRCGLSTCTVDLDDQTTMHYWTARHRRFSKPCLVIIHGYGSTAQWQFVRQVGSLSESFNLYIPDLLFFGESHTNRPDRSVEFQARCVGEGLKRLGVERCSMYAISYGGWVGYRMAEMFPEMVEKVVIVSAGVGFTEEQRVELLRKVGRRNMKAMLCPEKPEDLRLLAKQAMHKLSFHKWLPDLFLWEYINVSCAISY